MPGVNMSERQAFRFISSAFQDAYAFFRARQVLCDWHLLTRRFALLDLFSNLFGRCIQALTKGFRIDPSGPVSVLVSKKSGAIRSALEGYHVYKPTPMPKPIPKDFGFGSAAPSLCEAAGRRHCRPVP